MPQKYDITVAGEICLDIVPVIPEKKSYNMYEVLKPGSVLKLEGITIRPGGPVSNAGISLIKSGIATALMGCIGNDELGKMLFNKLKQYGNTDHITVLQQGRTSYTIAIAPPGIDRMYLHDDGANALFSGSHADTEIISRSKIFHFGYPPSVAFGYRNEGKALGQLVEQVKSMGVTTSLDLTMPALYSESGQAQWQKILANLLPSVDCFIPSIEELFFMLAPEAYFETKKSAKDREIIDFIPFRQYYPLAKKSLDLGAGIVALKTAHRGLYILTGDLPERDMGKASPSDLKNWSNRELWCPAFRVPRIASAVGSGDSCVAGFLTGYLRGSSIERTAKTANCLGYQNLHALDGFSGIKSWKDTTSLLDNQQLAMVDIPLDDHGWKWDSAEKVWIGEHDQND